MSAPSTHSAILTKAFYAGRQVLRLILLLVVSLLGRPTQGQAQKDTVHAKVIGRVVSRAGGPLRDAEVMLLGSQAAVLTDSLGWFHLSGAPPGVAVLRVRRIGFRTQYLRLNVDSSAASAIEVMP